MRFSKALVIRPDVCICQNLEGFEWRSETRLQMKRIKADPALRDTIREMLRRLALGILPPRFCKYTDKDGTIEFGVICHVVRATSEADRAKVAYCVRDLFEEGYFTYDKPWIKETGEEDGEVISYTYPPKLVVRSE